MGDFILENFLKIVVGILTAIVGVLARQVVKLKTQYMANQRGTKALLANEITKAHNFYMNRNRCHVNEKRIVMDMHEEYKALGGNGILTKLLNDIINLPEYDYERERRKEDV